MSKRLAVLLTVCCLIGGLVLVARPVPAHPPLSAQSAALPIKVEKENVPAEPPAGSKLATSRVAAVTVYPNSALVTREVDVPAGEGSFELVVTPLPPQTIQSSLYTEGSEGLRVRATRFRTRQLQEDTREDVRKLQDELRQLQMAKEKLDADVKAVQTNLHLLTKLETPATSVHPGDKAPLNSESAIALTKYIMEGRMEKSAQLVNLQQQLQLNQEKAEFARRKLNELAAGSSRTEQDAVIVVDKVNGAAGKVRLNYLVDAASWRPSYKLRAGKTAKEAVQLEYLAAVVQHTGEDWSNVQLVLSTAQPALNAAPPDLQVLNVTVKPHSGTAPSAVHHHPNVMELNDQLRDLRAQAQKDFNEKKEASGAGLFNRAAALDQSFELLNPDAALRRGCSFATKEGPSVAYHLNSKLTVPSRNDEQIIEVTRLEMSPDYYYKAVPVLTGHVYRLADLTNKSNYVLLPGDATMYIGSDFVGQMSMPLVAIGEQFTAGFGVD
ncbi:MAG: mucoidy inhibitor MuiA family protein, partial [Planctomycetia bacterium]|nr:mucoidy inhibitor MuiA family protein [Planctomycetia bacterium]